MVRVCCELSEAVADLRCQRSFVSLLEFVSCWIVGLGSHHNSVRPHPTLRTVHHIRVGDGLTGDDSNKVRVYTIAALNN
jgi:hypothetical protein